jgi:hypothetical protein
MMLKQISDVVRNVTHLNPEEGLPVLDTRVKPVVRILNASLDEDQDSPSSIIINGRVDPSTLRFLRVDSTYQRPLGDRSEIYQALKDGIVVPNIDIGVRGQNFTTEGDDILIHLPAYIIDGWQRVGTALRLLDQIPNHPIRIFATVHFGTDDVWERHRFTELNKNVRKVSPNLHLRNMRDSNTAVLTLYGLCHNDKSFALYGKVSWSQSMKRGDLVSALTLAKVARRLHSHATSLTGMSVPMVAAGLDETVRKVTMQRFRKNVASFFDVIHECWGLDAIEYRNNAPQVKSTFLVQLARVFSSHIDFWDQSESGFFVAADLRRKLAKFPINDPHIKSLAGTGGAAMSILYDLLVNHINSGKRTGHLRSRYSR